MHDNDLQRKPRVAQSDAISGSGTKRKKRVRMALGAVLRQEAIRVKFVRVRTPSGRVAMQMVEIYQYLRVGRDGVLI